MNAYKFINDVVSKLHGLDDILLADDPKHDPSYKFGGLQHFDLGEEYSHVDHSTKTVKLKSVFDLPTGTPEFEDTRILTVNEFKMWFIMNKIKKDYEIVFEDAAQHIHKDAIIIGTYDADKYESNNYTIVVKYK